MLTEQVGTQDQEKVFTFTIQPETGLSYRLLNNNSSRQRDVVVACWDYIESSALKGNSGLQGVENIVGKILRNQLDLWVCVDKDQIVGCCVIGAVTYPKAKAINFEAIGGKADYKECLTMCEQFYKSFGYKYARVQGRKGWKRALSKQGYKEEDITLLKEL
tara:strand:+ start:249 stop:731 length:483 start_codon:yes stop_codon:yes gene_type:complete